MTGARRDGVARLARASPEYREARAAFDAIKQAMAQGDPDGEAFGQLSEEYSVASHKLTDIENKHVDADPAYSELQSA